MQIKRWTVIGLMCLIGCSIGFAKEYSETDIYQGTTIKLDLLTSAIEIGRSKGVLQSYELATNVQLKNRYLPALEGGCAFGKDVANGGVQKFQGGFMRLGLDINGLKKNAHKGYALMVGLRLGGAVQQFDLQGVEINSNYWNGGQTVNFTNKVKSDWWGEIVASTHVPLGKGFMMGWAVRLKLLFTRENKNFEPIANYIPGYGFRDNTQWGLNYYIGWRF